MFNFDSDFNEQNYEAEGAGEFSPLPKGKYAAVISKASMSVSSDGATDILGFEFELENNGGRRVWDNLRLKTTNEGPGQRTMEKIARQRLASIRDALSIKQIRSADDFAGRKIILDIDIQPKYNDKTKMVNYVRAYKQVDATTPATADRPPAASDDVPF